MHIALGGCIVSLPSEYKVAKLGSAQHSTVKSISRHLPAAAAVIDKDVVHWLLLILLTSSK